MAKKVIGYQITNQNQDIPVGLYSFQLFKTAEDAFRYLREHELNKGLPASQCWFVKEYYEGDIENPTYIRNNSVKEFQVTLYYHTNVTVNVYAESEEQAKILAYMMVENHTQELIEGLEEDSAPDVCEVE
jgi:hypothetical protein